MGGDLQETPGSSRGRTQTDGQFPWDRGWGAGEHVAVEAEPGGGPDPSPTDLRALCTAPTGFILTPVRSDGERD